MIKAATSFLIWSMTCITIYGQEVDHKIITTDSLRFPGEMRSRKIPVSIGSFFEIPASCAKKPTTFIHASRFVFPDASIGRIDSCSLTYELDSDTIRKVIITLPNAIGVKQAGKQAAKQFGEPTYTKEGSTYVYAWKHITTSNAKELTIRLEVAADLQSAELFVE